MKKNWLIYKIHNEQLKQYAERHIKGLLIDIGCGDDQYKEMLAPYVRRHVGFDHLGTNHDKSKADFFASAYHIPVADNTFDSAICTAVLEHLEEPEEAVRECHRALKSGAVAIYSIPFIWHVHEDPRDFYRFTKYGIKYIFEKAGFEVIEVKALSGFWVTFGQLLVYNIYRHNRGALKTLRVVELAGAAIQRIAYVLDKVDRAERWTWMYMVAARKK